MNVEFVNPFLESILSVLGTMANTTAKPGKLYLKADKSAKGDVTGLIGLTGEKAKGSLAITFSEEAILSITTRMLGEPVVSLDDSVADCVGEITNMVTGGAKKILSEKGYTFDLALPSTIIGKGHSITHNTRGRVVCVPFETEAGPFVVEVCFEE